MSSENDPQAEGENSEMKIQITIEELKAWEARSAKLKKQLKSKEAEVEKMTKERESIIKEERARGVAAREGLEETRKMLQSLLDDSSQKNSDLEKKVHDLQNEKLSLLSDIKALDQEMEANRSASSQKYALECEIVHLKSEIESLKKKMEEDEDKLALQSQKTRLEELKEIIRSFQQQNEDLTRTIEDKQQTIDSFDHERDEFQSKLADEKSKYSAKDKEIEALKAQIEDIKAGFVDKVVEIEDLRMQRTILMKKSHNELKGVKTQLAKEKTLNEQLTESSDGLKKDLEKNQSEISQLKTEFEEMKTNVEKWERDSDTVSLPEASTRERSGTGTFQRAATSSNNDRDMIEDMATRLTELELENMRLRAKLDSFVQKTEKLTYIVQDKMLLIQNFAIQNVESTPNLDDIILEEEDKRAIKNATASTNIFQIQKVLEGTLKENIKLRQDILQLSTEMNTLMREQHQNQAKKEE